MTSETEDIFLTRAQIVEVAQAELGIPITISTIEKAGMKGTGPTVAARYGKQHLHKKSAAMEWVKSLITPVADNPSHA